MAQGTLDGFVRKRPAPAPARRARRRVVLEEEEEGGAGEEADPIDPVVGEEEGEAGGTPGPRSASAPAEVAAAGVGWGSREVERRAAARGASVPHLALDGFRQGGLPAGRRRCPHVAHLLHRSYRDALAFRQWRAPRAGGSGPGAAVRSLQFDAAGDLLASVSAAGGLAVHDALDVEGVGAERSAWGFGVAGQRAEPVVQLDLRRPAGVVRWDPGNQERVAVGDDTSRRLPIFDLARCTDGRAPTRVLEAPLHAQVAEVGSGFMDVLYLPPDRGPYTVAAACKVGGVFLWDCRGRSNAPAAALSAAGVGRMIRAGGAGACNALASVDGHTLVAGTSAGLLLKWDLRVTRKPTGFVRTSQKATHPVAGIDLEQALRRVPGLHDQLGTPDVSVRGLAADPRDADRLAFNLTYGWSGVYNLALGRVTHLHCPPPFQEPLDVGAMRAQLERLAATAAPAREPARQPEPGPAQPGPSRPPAFSARTPHRVIREDYGRAGREAIGHLCRDLGLHCRAYGAGQGAFLVVAPAPLPDRLPLAVHDLDPGPGAFPARRRLGHAATCGLAMAAGGRTCATGAVRGGTQPSGIHLLDFQGPKAGTLAEGPEDGARPPSTFLKFDWYAHEDRRHRAEGPELRAWGGDVGDVPRSHPSALDFSPRTGDLAVGTTDGFVHLVRPGGLPGA